MSEMAIIKRNPAAAKIAQAILEEYDVNSVEDMQSALTLVIAFDELQ